MAIRYPNTRQLKQELDGKKLAARYLFLGEEEGEKDKFISRIMSMAFSDERERTNGASRFHIENEEFFSAADFALSPSMFSARRICVMYNIDTLPHNKHSALFRDLIFNLPDSTILIMTAIGNSPPAFMKADTLASLNIIQFWKYFDNDIRNYLIMSLRRLGLTIEDRAVDLFIERTGNDIKKIDDAIDMIRFSGESVIRAESVPDIVDDQKDASIFDFIDSLFKLESKSLAFLKKIIENGTPDLKIIYMILRQAEMIEQYYNFLEKGMNAEEAAKQAGVYSKNRENFRRYTDKIPPEKLKHLFPLISRADYRLKSGGRREGLIGSPVFSLATGMIFDL
jgi:DNA polymerase III delta subunit